MALIEAPDGIRIGPNDPNDPNDDRLPILDFDEWTPNSGCGVLAAGEIKTLTFENLYTFNPGQSVMVRPLNPDQFNQPNLLISHAWAPDHGVIKVIVKNMSDEELDFGSDQWAIGGWRTSY
jgi:hypothetical protein